MTNPIRIGMFAVAGVLALQVPMIPTASAQSAGRASTCLPHGQVEESLSKGFNEKKIGHGISGDGNLIEVFMSSAGNFTVIKTSPGGVSCIVDFGEGWQTFDQLETALLYATPDVPEPFGR